ncbi:DUF2971 domain-containing protein [Pseudomonas aeruginosa]|uniref:DUF2971 domain-containing protein n=1 Tax=Pseudomonas aeruginosa TaxID=287 RepID=UPI0003B99DAB|nr:DUF2971 domain-containing protein [Pseudomonas aeruginosa]EKU1306711.1 DUF2971 domain-containing protein [Pseudomonas aeruginosa]EKU1944468.1 DUF2971 domain-containing protein [Pseudomonas aeruginosa]ERY48127.1 hypothetical protein Q059_00258 [Pseudomonas aeruginosa BL05]MBG4707850.1 DUF2971 domain-containing protein [Pseudomonas aeruginosa]MBI7739968.1 DUF2971 domain-containing protein [Pseudomonas aeruginosa]
MILYKYYGAASGMAAIESQRLGFRMPHFFNDPFELTALSNGDGPGAKLDTLRLRIEELKRQVVILSLTRSALNPLMWAHYGQEHTGVVVGYEVGGDFLGSQDYNLIPAESGDVIYTHTKSPFALTPATMDVLQRVYQFGHGATGVPSYEEQALARRLFLTKHASWVYEEEVRIVKILDSLFEESAIYQADPLREFESPDYLPEGLYLYNHRMPIKEVYLGARNTLQDNPGELAKVFEAGRKVYKLTVEDTSWQLSCKPLTR